MSNPESIDADEDFHPPPKTPRLKRTLFRHPLESRPDPLMMLAQSDEVGGLSSLGELG